MGHFQDLWKGKWELNQLYLTRENLFGFLFQLMTTTNHVTSRGWRPQRWPHRLLITLLRSVASGQEQSNKIGDIRSDIILKFLRDLDMAEAETRLLWSCGITHSVSSVQGQWIKYVEDWIAKGRITSRVESCDWVFPTPPGLAWGDMWTCVGCWEN